MNQSTALEGVSLTFRRNTRITTFVSSLLAALTAPGSKSGISGCASRNSVPVAPTSSSGRTSSATSSSEALFALVLYTFLGLAIVCDEYFCESLERKRGAATAV